MLLATLCDVIAATGVAAAGLDAAAASPAAAAAVYGEAPEGLLSPQEQQAMQQQPMRCSDTAAAVGSQQNSYGDSPADITAEMSRAAMGAVGGSSFKGSSTYDAAAGGVPPVVHTYQAYEDRPAVAKASYMGPAGNEVLGMDDDALIRADPSTVSAAALFGARGSSSAGVPVLGGGGVAKHSVGGGAAAGRDYDGSGLAGGAAAGALAGAACSAAAPAGWPGDLPPPEPLTSSSASDAAPVVEVAGEFVAAAFFSRNWQLRDAAAAWLADLVANGRLGGGAQEGSGVSWQRRWCGWRCVG